MTYPEVNLSHIPGETWEQRYKRFNAEWEKQKALINIKGEIVTVEQRRAEAYGYDY